MPRKGPEKSELESGIRVLSEPVPGVRSVSLGIWIDSGSRDEGEDEKGFCHFIEHMLFKGTPRMDARMIAEAFDNMGADINAITGREYTAVYSRVLDEYLPTAIEIASDMVENPLFKPRDFESERQVVLEEINMHLDSPDELVHDYLASTLWGGHPIGHSVLGDAEVIRTLNIESVKDFYARRYVSSGLVVVATGAVEHQRLCDMLSENILGLRRGRRTRREDSLEVPMSGTTIVGRDTEQAHIAIGGRGLSRTDPDRFPLAVIDTIVGGSMSSRLFQRIREERGLVYSIYSFNVLLTGMGMVGIYCGTHPSQAEQVIELIEDELVNVRDNGLSETELERTKKHIKGSLLISLEESSNRMNRIAKAELAEGEHLTVEELVERVENVTLDDLDRVFGNTWGRVGASLAVVGPFDDGDIGLSGRI